MNLFKHQEEAIQFIMERGGSGALFHDMGLGKTRTALEIFKRMRTTEPNLKLFVFAPLSLLEAAWGSDIKLFTNFSYCNLHDDKPRQADIYLINYESLLSVNKGKVIGEIIGRYPIMAVLDESSKIKNFRAITSKTLLKLRDHFKYRIVMSATPAPNTETEYWPQINFINDIFHPSFYKFRNQYFHLERNGQMMFQNGQVMNKAMAREVFSHGWKYGITSNKRVALMERINGVAHFAKKENCLDLPDQLDEMRLIEMGAKQASQYKQMRNELVLEIKDSLITAEVALTKITKLRQITSGFILSPDGQAHDIGENPKLRELTDVLEEAGDQQVIIWGNFRYEIHQIRRVLGDKATTLYGETKDKDASIKAFQSGQAQYLIANPHSAGHGLTFINCSLQIFFSFDYSWEFYFQAKGRTHRAGQVNKCTYIHLVCKNSIDEDILKVLQRKGSAHDIIHSLTHKVGKVYQDIGA